MLLDMSRPSRRSPSRRAASPWRRRVPTGPSGSGPPPPPGRPRASLHGRLPGSMAALGFSPDGIHPPHGDLRPQRRGPGDVGRLVRHASGSPSG